jgi:hypothetical protein
VNELLGALGLAWPRLVLYPGGIGALFGAWVLNRWWEIANREPVRCAPALSPIDLLPPLVALTLLPFPPARSFPYGLDLPTALFLAEWPRWRLLSRSGALAPERIRTLLAAYGLLLVGVGGMASAVGSLELTALTRWPEAPVDQVLLGAGMALWLAALPALQATAPTSAWPLRLRALLLLAIPTLVVIGALAALLSRWVAPPVLAWALPAPALILSALLAGGMVRLRASMRPLPKIRRR